MRTNSRSILGFATSSSSSFVGGGGRRELKRRIEGGLEGIFLKRRVGWWLNYPDGRQ